ncbi:hypothetical protein D3C78_1580260 [compost metagenome]
MLRVGRRGDNPAYLRQLALLYVVTKAGQHRIQIVAVGCRQRIAIALVQRGFNVQFIAIGYKGGEVFWRLCRVADLNAGGTVLAESRQWVVGEVIR